MLDPSVLTDLEELTLCGYCKLKYNDTEQCPKYLGCKHYFCLRCIETNLLKGGELFCAYCWKRTELGDQGPDALATNLPVLALANNFAYLKITSAKQPEKERKVIYLFFISLNIKRVFYFLNDKKSTLQEYEAVCSVSVALRRLFYQGETTTIK